ncbi:hypothetical protein glysoja_006812 [Glycine soja]|nr:hypothetical protein glysoja_006812 [Glycine soja]
MSLHPLVLTRQFAHMCVLAFSGTEIGGAMRATTALAGASSITGGGFSWRGFLCRPH